MRLNALLLIVVIVIGGMVTFWLDNGNHSPVGQSPLEEKTEVAANLSGDIAPDFLFITLNGQTHRLSDYQGKIVLLNFWATWCAPCLIEFPKLIHLAQENENLVVLALSSDMTQESIERFLKKIQNDPPQNFLISRDENRKVTVDLYQSFKLPETIVIDRNGNIVRKIVGDTDWNGEEMKAFLEGLKK